MRPTVAVQPPVMLQITTTIIHGDLMQGTIEKSTTLEGAMTRSRKSSVTIPQALIMSMSAATTLVARDARSMRMCAAHPLLVATIRTTIMVTTVPEPGEPDSLMIAVSASSSSSKLSSPLLYDAPHH